MGTKFAPPYACLSIGYLEETKFYPELYSHFSEEDCKFIIENFFRYMDDGFNPWPTSLEINILEYILNNLDVQIEFTLEPAKLVKDHNGNSLQTLEFLDIKVILHSSGKIETDVFYKPTNTHDYLSFDSHHPNHVKQNIPYTLAKRIMVFTSNPEKESSNLNDLKKWLLTCGYPKKLIQKKFHNAKLQGPANCPKKNNTISMVSTFSSNYDVMPILNKTKDLLKNVKDQKLKEVFYEAQLVLSLSSMIEYFNLYRLDTWI